jgi:hypothetical protein
MCEINIAKSTAEHCVEGNVRQKFVFSCERCLLLIMDLLCHLLVVGVMIMMMYVACLLVEETKTGVPCIRTLCNDGIPGYYGI